MEDNLKPETLIHVLNTNVGLPRSQQDLFRVRVNGTDKIKYLACNNILQEKVGRRFSERSLSFLPPGDHWNWGILALDVEGRFWIQSVGRRDLPSVPLWHKDKVDYSVLGDRQYEDDGSQIVRHRKSEVESFMFPGHHHTITVIMEWDPHHIGSVIAETEAYKRVDGMEIAPKFLAHLTENGDRVIGYLREKLPAGSRSATIEDLKVCQDVLGKLHKLGLILGLEGKDSNVSRKHFQITPSGDVRITDFQNSRQCRDPMVFEREMKVLEEKLGDLRPSDDEDVFVSETAMETFEMIGKRDGGLHPDVWDEILLTGTTTMTSLDHRWMIYYLRERNACGNNLRPDLSTSLQHRAHAASPGLASRDPDVPQWRLPSLPPS